MKNDKLYIKPYILQLIDCLEYYDKDDVRKINTKKEIISLVRDM